MSPFTTRPLIGLETLSERLARRRCQFDLSPTAVCEALGIRPYYLQALESGSYDALPGEIYIKNFLRRYAELLALSPQDTLQQFESEISALGLKSKWSTLGPQKSRWSIGWGRVSWAIAVPIFVALAYFGVMLSRYFGPPPLQINWPEGIVRQVRTVEVSGQTLPEVRLFLNDISVTKTPAGSFREILSVVPGLQTITLRAQRRFSRPRVITRQLIVE